MSRRKLTRSNGFLCGGIFAFAPKLVPASPIRFSLSLSSLSAFSFSLPFLSLKNYGLTNEVEQELYQEVYSFFDLPLEI